MSKVNWWRMLAGGVLATIICFVTDGLLHSKVVPDDWLALGKALGITAPPQDDHQHGLRLISFLDFELGRGFGGIFIYVMMRARYGPGPKTALWAAIAIWLICSVTGPAQFIPLGFYSHTLWIKVAAFQLVTTLAATFAAAALYREGPGPARTA